MPQGEIHIGDHTTYIITVKDENGGIVDISTATTIEMILDHKHHSKAPVTKTATLTTDGTDGKMQWKDDGTTVDTSGTWRIQGRVVMLDGSTYKTDISSFVAYRNI
jgi:hypothetical protein